MMFKQFFKPLRPRSWSDVREGMLVRIFYILTTITGTLFCIWFLFFFLREESVLCFFNEIEENKAKLQIFILISGLPLFLLLWGFRTEDTNTKLFFEAVSLLGSKEARRQALDKLLFLKNNRRVFKDKICRIIEGADFSSKEDVLNLSNMDLKHQSFKLADFSCSNLSRSNLTGAILERANLQRSNLEFTILKNAILEHARLQKANLKGASLTGVNLTWASLQEARLINAELRKANLEGADLRGADLQDADLTGANLENTKLNGACYNEQTKGLTEEQKKVMKHV